MAPHLQKKTSTRVNASRMMSCLHTPHPEAAVRSSRPSSLFIPAKSWNNNPSCRRADSTFAGRGSGCETCLVRAICAFCG
eukprot:scaffold2817_cov130-Cylindrotheca_fusiformis.AAC.4